MIVTMYIHFSMQLYTVIFDEFISVFTDILFLLYN